MRSCVRVHKQNMVLVPCLKFAWPHWNISFKSTKEGFSHTASSIRSHPTSSSQCSICVVTKAIAAAAAVPCTSLSYTSPPNPKMNS